MKINMSVCEFDQQIVAIGWKVGRHGGRDRGIAVDNRGCGGTWQFVSLGAEKQREKVQQLLNISPGGDVR